MLFGLKKKEEVQSNLPKQLLEFLNQADEDYMRAFNIRSTKVLGVRFTRECVLQLARVIYSEGNVRFFGTDKFRTTDWDIVDQTADKITLIKRVTFDKIKVSKSFKMALSENYTEKWTVVTPSYSVCYVTRVDS